MRDVKHSTIKTCARDAGIDEQLLRRAIHRGEVPVGIWFRVGRRYFVHVDRFSEWIAAGGSAAETSEGGCIRARG